MDPKPKEEIRGSIPYEEKTIRHLPGMPVLIISILLILLATFCVIAGGIHFERYGDPLSLVLLILGILYFCICYFPFLGLRVLKPQEALVFTLFGKYVGTLNKEGFYFVNPFVTAVNPTGSSAEAEGTLNKLNALSTKKPDDSKKKISLKAITLNNGKQKINDLLGNPIEIGIVVIWRVTNPTKAVFNVDNYMEYLSTQADSALRNIVRLYPYDISEGEDECSLRGSSQEIADHIKAEIQSKVDIAGLEIMEARITHLAYAPEIAAAMLQRQQASAIIDARKMIVDGAVGMVEMALSKLSEQEIVELDEERKAAMVSNLLVVLCGNKDAQPVVNSGSIY